MFTPRYCLPLLLLLAASPAAAQTTSDGDQPGKEPSSNAASNLNAATASHTWAPSLPTPPVAENAPPTAFIQAALNALAAGRTGEAQEAIERAESRVLTRSVRPSRADQPSHQPLIQQLAAARDALAGGDRLDAVSKLQAALKNPEASEPD
jgi:hypothetical protein